VTVTSRKKKAAGAAPPTAERIDMSTTTTSTDRDARVADIARSLRLLHEPGEVFEVRALGVAKSGTVSGYYDDVDRAAQDVYTIDGDKPEGIYTTLNPCRRELLARANNRFKPWAKHTTGDAEILCRRWLLVDIDPQRPSGICATEEEKATARELAADVEDILRSRGWAFPLIVDSGNGCYLLYRIDLPNDDATADVLKRFYGGLNSLLPAYDPSRPHSLIDTGVHNAARIIRIGGTWNAKGDSTTDRPHRLCVYHDPVDECPL
jgi:hypothetical protein